MFTSRLRCVGCGQRLIRSTHTLVTSSVASTSKLPYTVPLRPSTAVATECEWTTVIGLELHVQLKGNVKLLSHSLAAYDSIPNTHVTCIDAALPGSLPRLGAEPVRLALLACLALKSEINPSSTFDRKHYFYHDLPAGFQVTQKYSPLATGGIVRVRSVRKGATTLSKVRINQIQLEQDTAKSSHDVNTGLTLVDLNRAGAALIEIVTEPDMRSAEDAAAFVRQLQAILRHIGASDANMDRGEMRCDVNVSVHRSDSEGFGTRCEIKNLNGVRYLMGAIESESKRQIAALEAGETIEQATRGYNVLKNETFHLRSKGDAPDYRYMPDPELGAVVVDQELLDSLQLTLPELPDAAFDRLQSQYSLTPRDSGIIVALGEGMEDDEDSGHQSAGSGVRYFEEIAVGRDSRAAANWVIHELLGGLAKANLSFAQTRVTAAEIGQLIDAVTSEKVTGTVAKLILRSLITSPSSSSLSALIEEQSKATSSIPDLEFICQTIIDKFPNETSKIRAGQTKVMMRLVGEVMKATKGQANAKQVSEIIQAIIMK